MGDEGAKKYQRFIKDFGTNAWQEDVIDSTQFHVYLETEIGKCLDLVLRLVHILGLDALCGHAQQGIAHPLHLSIDGSSAGQNNDDELKCWILVLEEAEHGLDLVGSVGVPEKQNKRNKGSTIRVLLRITAITTYLQKHGWPNIGIPASTLILCSEWVKFRSDSSLTFRCGAKHAIAHSWISTPT